MNFIKRFKVSDLVLLEWNRELVQVVEQWGMCTKIKSLKLVSGVETEGAVREVSTGTEVTTYEGQFVGDRCVCGCGRLVLGRRKDAQYATSACRKRVSRSQS